MVRSGVVASSYFLGGAADKGGRTMNSWHNPHLPVLTDQNAIGEQLEIPLRHRFDS
jgi:hypothetical protein